MNETDKADLVGSPHNTTDTTNGQAATCNVCCKSASNPYRRYDEHGKVTEGCVSDFHAGHLIATSESNRWHYRTQAKAIRAQVRKQWLSWQQRANRRVSRCEQSITATQ